MGSTGGSKFVFGDDLDLALVELDKARGRRRIAVAYVSGDAAARFRLRSRDVAIVDASPATLGAGLTDPSVLETWHNAGADLYSYEGLHAKIYIVGAAALIGSANLSASSRDRLTEAAVVTGDASLVEPAARAVLGLMAASLPLTAETLKMLKPLYRPPKGRLPGRGERGVLPSSAFRLRLVEVTSWTPSQHTARKAQQLARAAGLVRRQAGLVLDTMWLEPGEEGTYRPDDVLLHAWAEDDGQRWVAPPARVLRTAAVDRRASAAWVVRERAANPVLWEEVQRALRSSGVPARRTRWLRDPAPRQAVLQLFGLDDVRPTGR